MEYEIIHLPKEQWKDTIIPIRYTTYEYYDVRASRHETGFKFEIEKKKLDQPITHYPEEYNFPDRLYQDHYEHSYAWGVVIEGKLVAAIETNQELWSNRLRITDLWVAEEYQKQGIGHALIEIAKEQARLERHRAIILETQSCNVNAIGFYLHEGFSLIGLDTCCYSNKDIERKEVRLEFGWFLNKPKKLSREDLEIRGIEEEDWYDVELMTRRAFWNKYRPRCDEHFLVDKLRRDRDYLPELSRIAVKDGKIIGLIMYSKSKVIDEDKEHELLTFGPLCVDPDWQGCRVGALLLEETSKLAADLGYKGIVIYGEPDYYPRLGFKTCDNYNITTADGKNFDAFMAYELAEGSMKGIKGRHYIAKVYDELPADEAEEFDKKFPKLKKQKFPCQW